MDERWQLVQFTIDHIVPISEGGTGALENLALACFHCNRKKSDKQKVFDLETNSEILLFNPRTMLWNEHFVWSSDGLRIISLTEIGKVTVELFELNRKRILQIRRDDVLVNRHPHRNDAMQTSE
jgi:hypothetical protein